MSRKLPQIRRKWFIPENILLQEDRFSTLFLNSCTTAVTSALSIFKFDCTDSTNHRSKLLEKSASVLNMQSHFSYHHFLYKIEYLSSVNIVLDNISNLEMIKNVWKDICRLHIDTVPFYVRSLHEFGCRKWF